MQNSRDRDHKKLVSRLRPVSRPTALVVSLCDCDIISKAKGRGVQENSICAAKFLQNRILTFTGPIDLKAAIQQNSQLALFSDKGIGA